MSLTQLESVSANNYCYSMNEQLRQFVYARSREAFIGGDAARERVVTAAALRERQNRAREVFLAGLGGLPPMDTPLNARVTGTTFDDGFRVERIIFESRPNTPVTASLYLPDAVTSGRGAVLFLCGHKAQAKHDPEYQVVCRHLVKAGLVVMAQDPIGQGERLSYYEAACKTSTCTDEHGYAGAQCLPLGDGIARYFLHDAMRGVDYLLSRAEVGAARIGVTGNSGGGTQTAMMMMVDPRIAAAAPGTFITSRWAYQQTGGGQDAEQIWWGFTAAGFDHEDILLAMCPKPVCVLAVASDFFPIEGTRETVARCRRLWRMAGREEDLVLVEDASTHSYTPALACAAASFFSRHLLGREMAVDSATVSPIEPQRLWCTASGQVRGEIVATRAVYEENQDRLASLEASRCREPQAERRQRALAWLHEVVCSGRHAAPLNLRLHPDIGSEDELTADLGYWWSQKGLLNEGLLVRSCLNTMKTQPVTLAVWDGGTTSLRPHIQWIRKTCQAGRVVLVLSVSGVGGSQPGPPNANPVHERPGILHKLSGDMVWLEDSLCALRAYDVLRSLDVIDEWPGVDASDVAVYACGKQGVYAELAATLETRLAKIDVVDPLEDFAALVSARHYDSFCIGTLLLPAILQYTDLSELREWRKS